MANIIPFKAVRPTRDKVSLVASRAYDAYSVEQRDARLNTNPYSFLHIINPGYKFHKEISGKARYALVKNRYLEFKEEHIFVQDHTPSYYVYCIVDRDGQECNGIIAAASAEDYQNNIIKKHESTLAFREIIFKDYLKAVRFNAEPVLLTYPDNPKLKEIIAQVKQDRADFEFTTTTKDTHYLWPVNNAAICNTIQAIFKAMPSVYIADGHHRCASSYMLYLEEKSKNNNHTGTENYNFFMAYLIPESDLRVYEFNRLVSDLNGLNPESFLIQLDTYFRIENRGNTPYKPSKSHHFSMYLNGDFYSLYLRKTAYTFKTALDRLDAYILYKTILKPILGISNLRQDKRITYSTGKNGFLDIKSKVDAGDYKVGFSMLAATTNQIKQIADEGLQMPPKSTYIEPKLRSGITIFEF